MEVGSIMKTAESAMLRESSHMNEIAHDVANEKGNMADQMVDMMQTQRSFEANAVMISTADEMVDELLGM